MAVSTAEKNRRKRERKKRAREEEKKRQLELINEGAKGIDKSQEEEEEVEIEYVVESPLVELTNNSAESNGGDKSIDNSIAEVLRRFHARSTVLVSDDDESKRDGDDDNDEFRNSRENDDDDGNFLSKNKLRRMNRPTVAELKNRVERSDLVEAHDVTSADPDFLLYLKALPGTVPVPRHWGRKRKYLQGKRGIEKAPFQLPDFIARTGISEVRSALDEDEKNETIRKKNRSRVAPKMGALDVDYRTLHDAFFKHQNKASIQEKITKIGDLYYEGKEFETQKSKDIKVGGELSARLRDALGMTAENSPPPWLINMQRFGPPPSYPNLKIPGLNAALPDGCSYGYHLSGWGKPPVDAFGRPLYGGNPFDKPGANDALSTADWDLDATSGAIVTSDGKTVGRKPWGGLPMAAIDIDDGEDGSSSEEESDDDSSSAEEMESESEEEEGEEKETTQDNAVDKVPASDIDLRKQAGDETPAPAQQLYTVLQQTEANKEKQSGAMFTSDVQYVMPGSSLTAVPEGAESVLSKAPLANANKRKRNNADEDDEDADLGKKFKF
mmetsp:Transcript_285/g.383  ORF Transcript_285/g.383 Transcript_285/m.383 type:complete len:555 (-) Transcript_285:418-2082(-)